MDTYLKHLSESVLAEDKVVDFRLLSQSLQVPVNTAKQMLYEFHRSQNAKRPGSVHATYLIYGVKHNSNSQNGADEEMPDAGSVTDVVPVFDLCLVTEEKLRDVLAEFEEVKTIHVYSVASRPTKDMALLADVAHEVSSNDKKVLSNIVNPNVRTRERKGPGLKASIASTPAFKQQPKAASKVKEDPKPAEETKPAIKTEKTEKTTSSAPAKKPAPAKSSGIMAAFSKAASLPKKEPKKSASPAVTETNTPALSDEDDDEEEMPQPKPAPKPDFKTLKQREEGLRRMMEGDDEEEAPASERAESPEEPEPEPMEVEEEAPDPVKEEKEVVETTSNGRRRGKRRIMRKKQIMDEQGYLVTIQEPGWESFSEDEAPPAPKVVKTTSSASSTQAKKGAAKGQGNIMSFFSKKA